MANVTNPDRRSGTEGFFKINFLFVLIFFGAMTTISASRGLNSANSEITFKSVHSDNEREPASLKTAAIHPARTGKKVSAPTKTASNRTYRAKKSAEPSKKTYMDCQSQSVLFPRVVLKAKRARDLLTQFEVILVDEKGKSSIYQSQDSLDWRFLNPQTLENKNILIIGNSKATTRENGIIENATAVSLFESMDATEDMACLSVENRIGHSLGMPGTPPLKNRQLLNEVRYQKFSGTLYHKDKLVPLTCFSPMLPRESNCGLAGEMPPVRDDELSAL